MNVETHHIQPDLNDACVTSAHFPPPDHTERTPCATTSYVETPRAAATLPAVFAAVAPEVVPGGVAAGALGAVLDDALDDALDDVLDDVLDDDGTAAAAASPEGTLGQTSEHRHNVKVNALVASRHASVQVRLDKFHS